jgi:CarD family transcriptional regulator
VTNAKPAPKAAPVKVKVVVAPAKAGSGSKPVQKITKVEKKPVVQAIKAPAAKSLPVKPQVAPVQAVVASQQPKAAVTPPHRVVSAAVSKPAGGKISAPATTAGAAVKRAPAPVQAGVQAGADAAAKKPVSSRHGFKTNESIVYPTHGVGRIIGIEEQEIAGITLELFVIQFEKDKMTLRVPTSKLASVGMRKLAEDDIVKKAMETLKGKARIKRIMWSRRAQEYEAKINSGDLVAIAEVVRDLYRSEAQPEQSYSERQLYEAALDRMAREIAAVDKVDERGAMQRITEVLSKSAQGRRAIEEEAAQADAEVKAA